MRAFAASDDQTRPTIELHGVRLAIGPAGVDPHGPWGIHVEPPVDGRAQELREQLEQAARRVAGSKGAPPRLVDESPAFDRRATGHWAPGAQRREPAGRAAYYEPALVAPPAATPEIPSAAPRRAAPLTVPPAPGESQLIASRRTPQFFGAPLAPGGGGLGPVPGATSLDAAAQSGTGWTSPVVPTSAPDVGRRTALGYAGSDEAAPVPVQGAAAPAAGSSGSFSALAGRTMPLGLTLSDAERRVLDALGRGLRLGAAQVAALAGVSDGVAWMRALADKLAAHGIELFRQGTDGTGEASFELRR